MFNCFQILLFSPKYLFFVTLVLYCTSIVYWVVFIFLLVYPHYHISVSIFSTNRCYTLLQFLCSEPVSLPFTHWQWKNWILLLFYALSLLIAQKQTLFHLSLCFLQSSLFPFMKILPYYLGIKYQQLYKGHIIVIFILQIRKVKIQKNNLL